VGSLERGVGGNPIAESKFKKKAAPITIQTTSPWENGLPPKKSHARALAQWAKVRGHLIYPHCRDKGKKLTKNEIGVSETYRQAEEGTI